MTDDAANELSLQIRALALTVDALARAELARATSDSLLQQLLRELAKDVIATREKVDFIHAHTRPRKLKAVAG